MKSKYDESRLASRRLGILSLTIAVLLSAVGGLLILIPGQTIAAQDGDYTYTVSGLPLVATITGYTGPGGNITIPSTLGGYPTKHIGIDAFDYITTIISVVMPSSLISIDDQAFQFCSALTSVTIGSNVQTIKGFAFNHCTALLSVIIPNSVTIIGDSVFAYCVNMTSITIGSGVASIGMSSFDSCSSLTSITFLGLTAPTYVGAFWIQNTNAGIRGHAYIASNFPAPGVGFYGLIMGSTIDSPTVPNAPTGLVATPGFASVILNWTAPASNGGSAITNYSVYRSTISGGEIVLLVLGNVITYTDANVTINQTYYYKVTASNSIGEGPLSEEASATPIDIPIPEFSVLMVPILGIIGLVIIFRTHRRAN